MRYGTDWDRNGKYPIDKEKIDEWFEEKARKFDEKKMKDGKEIYEYENWPRKGKWGVLEYQ
jgi:hypothetical protein